MIEKIFGKKTDKTEPAVNEADFKKLIKVIDVQGRAWLDTESDMLNDSWHTALTHKDPEILRGFGFQCLDKADLMEAIKIVDDFQVEAHDLVNGVANKLELPDNKEKTI